MSSKIVYLILQRKKRDACIEKVETWDHFIEAPGKKQKLLPGVVKSPHVHLIKFLLIMFWPLPTYIMTIWSLASWYLLQKITWNYNMLFYLIVSSVLGEITHLFGLR